MSLEQHDRAFALSQDARRIYDAAVKQAGEARNEAKRIIDVAAGVRYQTTRTALERARVVRPRTPEVEAEIAELEAALRAPWPAPDHTAAETAFIAAVKAADRVLAAELQSIRERRDRGHL